MHGRKQFEITGYADTENGVAYCLNCIDNTCEGYKEKFTPIFLGDEWDAPGPACNNCHTLIEITPIHYCLLDKPHASSVEVERELIKKCQCSKHGEN